MIRIRRIIIICLLCLALQLASGCTSTGAAPKPTSTPGPLDKVIAYDKAFNAHDVDAILGMLTETPDLFYEDYTSGGTTTTPPSFLEFMKAINSQEQLSDCTLSNSQATCKANYMDDCIASAGLTSFDISPAVFTFTGDQLSNISLSGVADASKMTSFWSGMTAWGMKNKRDQINIAYTDWMTIEIFTQKTGTALSTLCKAYAAR